MPGSLFERLTPGPDAADPDVDASLRVRPSLVRPARVPGAREGAARARPSCGLPDINDISLSPRTWTVSPDDGKVRDGA